MVREQFPELASRYEHTYRHSVYASDSYRTGLEQYMDKLCTRYGLTVRRYRRDGDRKSPKGRTEDYEEEIISSEIVRQLTLF